MARRLEMRLSIFSVPSSSLRQTDPQFRVQPSSLVAQRDVRVACFGSGRELLSSRALSCRLLPRQFDAPIAGTTFERIVCVHRARGAKSGSAKAVLRDE